MLVRPRRSALYMPGSNLRALHKARNLAADVLVFDLEDSVAPENKVLAREQVCNAIKEGGYGSRELVVRVNALNSDVGILDIEAVAQSGADGLCLPKVESADDIVAAVSILTAAGAPAAMQIWAMIETPMGVLNAQPIAAADPRLAVIVMGTTDLAKELRVTPSQNLQLSNENHREQRQGLLYSLSHCVLAARAYQKDILDGVYLDLENAEGLFDVCQQGVELGFDGKTLIHPKQLEAANQCFAPTEETLERARNILQAWGEAEKQGRAVAVVDGQLVELMHVDEAKRSLMMAEAICP